MAQSVLKHQDDDGSLSVFAAGDLLLFACEHGHYWTVDAEQQSSESLRARIQERMPAEEAEALLRAF